MDNKLLMTRKLQTFISFNLLWRIESYLFIDKPDTRNRRNDILQDYNGVYKPKQQQENIH